MPASTEQAIVTAPPPRILAAVAVLAGTTLGVQIALTRLFSFLYWHHFAFMIIGIGMLGFGAAGAWLARRGGVEPGADTLRVAGMASLCGAAGLLVYLGLGPALRFEPLALLDEPAQFFQLFALYALMLLPFTALGLAQGALIAGYRRYAHRVYAMDLIGAGLGCLGTLALLDAVSAPAALLVYATLASGCAVAIGLDAGARQALPAWTLAALASGLLALGWADARPFIPAPSKELADLYPPEGHPGHGRPFVDHTSASATIRLDVSPSKQLPFMFGGDTAAPARERQVPSRVVYQDGAAPTLLLGIDDLHTAAFLGKTSQSLAYQIREHPRVCVIGAGGGPDIWIALHNGAQSVRAVELNPQMLALGREVFADFVRGLYGRPDVDPVVAEGRHFLARTDEHFDVIQMSGVDTYAALASGAYTMSENYLYTVEAGRAVLAALEPDGLFSNSRWILDPPRETLRLVDVLLEALRLEGAAEPAAHVFVMKAKRWATTLVSKRPFEPDELATLRGWVAARGWTVVLDPAGRGSEPFVKLAHSAGQERRAFLAAYPYDVSAVDDDRPFFFQFYRLRNLLGGPASEGGYPITRVPVGYAVLAASLLQMALLSALFILGPLWSRRSGLRGVPGLGPRLVFFAALGAGFMAIEITAIQAFTVFLGHPVYSMAITLTALLIATGLGSAWAGASAAPPGVRIGRAVAGVVGWALLTGLALQPVLDVAIAWPLGARAALVALWLVPAGLCLGVPFPTAIAALQAERPALVPWAWGVNGCFSVLSSLGTVLVAMQLGFRATLALAALVYLGGALAYRHSGASERVPLSDRVA
jgi:spermidine synthase